MQHELQHGMRHILNISQTMNSNTRSTECIPRIVQMVWALLSYFVCFVFILFLFCLFVGVFLLLYTDRFHPYPLRLFHWCQWCNPEKYKHATRMNPLRDDVKTTPTQSTTQTYLYDVSRANYGFVVNWPCCNGTVLYHEKMSASDVAASNKTLLSDLNAPHRYYRFVILVI